MTATCHPLEPFESSPLPYLISRPIKRSLYIITVDEMESPVRSWAVVRFLMDREPSWPVIWVRLGRGFLVWVPSLSLSLSFCISARGRVSGDRAAEAAIVPSSIWHAERLQSLLLPIASAWPHPVISCSIPSPGSSGARRTRSGGVSWLQAKILAAFELASSDCRVSLLGMA